MALRFVVQARAIVREAEKEAAEAGSPVIEAEHMLLTMVGEHGIEGAGHARLIRPGPGGDPRGP